MATVPTAGSLQTLEDPASSKHDPRLTTPAPGSATAVDDALLAAGSVVSRRATNRRQRVAAKGMNEFAKADGVRPRKKLRRNDTELCGSCGFQYGDCEDPLIEDDWAVCVYCYRPQQHLWLGRRHFICC